ncbi:Tetratricopeptide repeat protein 8 like protein [Aduncisulcus paluster]|uniref:Tetratricopeptide repeat protein 8 like protein n=1 Tax=Aduncisulcus paluster TaxID=2918883 RepID=A0ABQ5KRS4_9EUKA|nr:Tetratricopeptide repeat protein 8 like protein [Aduncisulcus paluster]
MKLQSIVEQNFTDDTELEDQDLGDALLAIDETDKVSERKISTAAAAASSISSTRGTTGRMTSQGTHTAARTVASRGISRMGTGAARSGTSRLTTTARLPTGHARPGTQNANLASSMRTNTQRVATAMRGAAQRTAGGRPLTTSGRILRLGTAIALKTAKEGNGVFDLGSFDPSKYAQVPVLSRLLTDYVINIDITPQRALALLSRMPEDKYTQSFVCDRRGQCMSLLRDYERASDEFTRAERSSPLPRTIARRARSLARCGRIKEALGIMARQSAFSSCDPLYDIIGCRILQSLPEMSVKSEESKKKQELEKVRKHREEAEKQQEENENDDILTGEGVTETYDKDMLQQTSRERKLGDRHGVREQFGLSPTSSPTSVADSSQKKPGDPFHAPLSLREVTNATLSDRSSLLNLLSMFLRSAISKDNGNVEAHSPLAAVTNATLSDRSSLLNLLSMFLRSAISKDNGNVEAHSTLAAVEFSQGKVSSSLSRYRRLLRLIKNSEEVWENIALCLMSIGYVGGGLGAFVRGVRCGKSNGHTSCSRHGVFDIGCALLNIGDLKTSEYAFHLAGHGSLCSGDVDSATSGIGSLGLTNAAILTRRRGGEKGKLDAKGLIDTAIECADAAVWLGDPTPFYTHAKISMEDGDIGTAFLSANLGVAEGFAGMECAKLVVELGEELQK